MITTEPNFKKIHRRKREKTSIYLLRWRHKNQKNTRETRVVIHLSTRSYDAIYRVRESKSKLEPFTGYLESFLAYFFGPRLNHMFEQSLKLLLRIPKWFNAFQVLKWFSFLLRVCVIFARTINNDVWQAMVARAIESQKNWGNSLVLHCDWLRLILSNETLPAECEALLSNGSRQ